MLIRQSSLTQFGDSLVRFMSEAGSKDEEVKYTLEYMHSVYNGQKVLTLISAETGGMVLFGPTAQQGPGPTCVMIHAARLIPSDQDFYWFVVLPSLGIQQKQKFAQWLVDVFKSISFMDTKDQFEAKVAQLVKDGAEQGLTFLTGGGWNLFNHQQFQI
jgi:hypothetical protein